MCSKPTFSVILTTYNGEEFIEETLNSIDAQVYKDFELIISDDNSSDSTVEKIEEHRIDASEFIKRNENVGIARNMNRAVSEANGEYLAFIDQDDKWHQDKLEKHSRAHCTTSAEIVYSDIIELNTIQDDENVISAPRSRQSGDELIKQLLQEHNFIETMSGVTMVREIWEEYGGFDEYLQLACDYDFWFRTGLSQVFHHLPFPLVEKKEHLNNTSGDTDLDHGEVMYILDKLEWKCPHLRSDIIEKRIDYHFITAWKHYQETSRKSAFRYCAQSIKEDGPLNHGNQGFKPYLLMVMIFLDSLFDNVFLGQKIYEKFYSLR